MEAEPRTEAGRDALATLKRLTDFSARLLQSGDVPALLEALLDEAIDLTRGDRGFLVLVEAGQRSVKVARNVNRENVALDLERLSDTVVDRVLRTGEPLLVSDATADPEFSASTSVVNLKLSSVLCVPLMHRGRPFGLVYLGSDRVGTHFDRSGLDTLTIFAAQASLLVHNALLVDELRADNRGLRAQLEQHSDPPEKAYSGPVQARMWSWNRLSKEFLQTRDANSNWSSNCWASGCQTEMAV